ncbi:FAD-dependent thymidylate synthase [Bradyrhizobium barranii subsp. barranii]|uniref:Flavin-dependent thymidylate synthase n=1 Tax=Bradyrhizobium barranii subsp. barranii TaxID=2823807 RepID=A0A939S241_9BRAD|nr:FAD-dependent thymidylate synthase [Bradyrhizobium barranii]UEM13869.1 FAD-dependent thymidylate synthase [Bradyrhizobium barranii subsp. barranii]
MPKLFVLARPSFTDEFATFLAEENEVWRFAGGSAAERLVEFAGRICYMSFGRRQSPKRNSEYIGNLIRQGHESVLEHVSWTFLLSDVTRSFTHQLVRHRAGFSFSQLSQQYHDESDARSIVPEGLDDIPGATEVFERAVNASREAYRQILAKLASEPDQSKESLRAIRSAARSVLLNATETKIVITANARAIRHFLDVRGAIDGDVEMRRVAKLIYDVLIEDAPALVADFVEEKLSDGTPRIVKIRQLTS